MRQQYESWHVGVALMRALASSLLAVHARRRHRRLCGETFMWHPCKATLGTAAARAALLGAAVAVLASAQVQGLWSSTSRCTQNDSDDQHLKSCMLKLHTPFTNLIKRVGPAPVRHIVVKASSLTNMRLCEPM